MQSFRNVVNDSERKLMIFGDRFPFRYFVDEYGLNYYAAFPGMCGGYGAKRCNDGVSD